MVEAKIEQGVASPAMAGWIGVDADAYLDARQSGWRALESGGFVRYARPLGERRGRVFVAPTATEIVAALEGLSVIRLEKTPPAGTGVHLHR